MEKETFFASPDRTSKQTVISERKKLESSDMLATILEATNTLFMILNENRQVVFANTALLELLKMDSEKIIGQRPGELLDCINAREAPSGCGTHRFCKECGALDAILSAQRGVTRKNECRINAMNENKHLAWDLSVKASPFEFDSNSYILFSVTDISDAKRKEVLERTFFHDILNTAGAAYGFSEFLKEELEEEQSIHTETAQNIYDLTDRLINEIKNQRQLLAAERNELNIEVEPIKLPDYIHSLISVFDKFKKQKDYSLKIIHCDEFEFHSDKTLLNRVLINMIKNATEACGDKQEILVNVEKKGSRVVFSVHNETYIEESVQHQIFQRSFSTKGRDRGIGTYSMKLFGEDYLRGKVWFTSEKERGTTFYLELPITIS
ncbi:MAG: GHKL domain-containing protein [Bacteroidales bacterium]|nr:GHKL domain-containing protein [Bacteroidales bacterium]